MTDREWKPGIAASVDVTLLGRYYERFANHAVEVGRRVIFQTTDITKTSTRPRT
jgi:phosphate transport system protein